MMKILSSFSPEVRSQYLVWLLADVHVWLLLSLLQCETLERSVDLTAWHNGQRSLYWLDFLQNMSQFTLLTVHWYVFPMTNDTRAAMNAMSPFPLAPLMAPLLSLHTETNFSSGSPKDGKCIRNLLITNMHSTYSPHLWWQMQSLHPAPWNPLLLYSTGYHWASANVVVARGCCLGWHQQTW